MAQGSAHKPNNATRALVASRKAQGYTNEEIAKQMCLSSDTLVKYYPEEIATARLALQDEIFEAFRRRVREGSDKMLTLALTHTMNPNGWRSVDKMAEVDALKEQTAALERKAEIDARVAELRESREQ